MIEFNIKSRFTNKPPVALYKNRDWLQGKYWNEELLERQIGELCGVHRKTIGYWLRRFGIPHRSISEAIHLREGNYCTLSQRTIEWINGELLGDGSLNSQSSYSAQFTYTSKYLEYIEYVSNALESFGIGMAGTIYKEYREKWDRYVYHYSSRRYVELLPVRKQWYPNSKKVIPRNLKLTPLTLRQFYIGDGCLRKPKVGGPFITLATCGFSVLDVQWLVGELAELGFRATKRPSDNTIGISTYSTENFLDYIGKCPIDCYQYKWDYSKKEINK